VLLKIQHSKNQYDFFEITNPRHLPAAGRNSKLQFQNLEFICHLACLREAAPAKAGALDLVLFPSAALVFQIVA
jgi:hypothetical protein